MDKHPIQRHSSIAQFSREHHFGLLLGYKIKQGLRYEVTPERIRAYILYAFDKEIMHHFEEEERVLFPALPGNNELIVTALEQHTAIRNLLINISSDKFEKDQLSEMAALIEEHIRFEERQLFNYLQDNLEEATLNEISGRHIHAKQDHDKNWPDHFWIKPSEAQDNKT